MNDMPSERHDFGRIDIERTARPDGSIELRSRLAPGPYVDKNGEWLRRWAAACPERTFLAERDGEGWRRIAYGEALGRVERLGQALLDRGLSIDRTVVVLSDNSINNGLLQLAAQYVGVPVVPISVGYSLLSEDFARLRYAIQIARPGLIYADDGAAFERALGTLAATGAELVVERNAPSGLTVTRFDELLATSPTAAVAAAFDAVGPNTVAKLLFTSGSTGMPKAVINLQRMICSNQTGTDQVWPFVLRKPPVLVDWLPWNHTFGGNYIVNFVLSRGGTLYIDDGRPVPQRIERTISALREISPTAYLNVPRGYDMVVPFLERDEALCRTFFRDLDMLFYAAASLPKSLWDRLETLSQQTVGHVVPMLTSWGMTETGPMHTAVHSAVRRSGLIGVPLPGSAMKLVPNAGKLELRVRGPNVTPGYWQDGRILRDAFDEDGWLMTGDAVTEADPLDPDAGVVFDGRTAENFKLASGVWVHVDELRVAAIAALSPIAQDAVITGHDRDEIGLLLFANLAGCRAVADDPSCHDDPTALVRDPAILRRLIEGLEAYNGGGRSSSRRVARLMLMTEPPLADANEITDKGYVNQRAVLDRRAVLVERLYRHTDGRHLADAAGISLFIPAGGPDR